VCVCVIYISYIHAHEYTCNIYNIYVICMCDIDIVYIANIPIRLYYVYILHDSDY